MGLLMGLCVLQKLGVSKVLIEGDFSSVIGWGWGLSLGSWRFAHFIHEIRDLLTTMDSSISHVPRSQNALVDSLANWGWGYTSVLVPMYCLMV